MRDRMHGPLHGRGGGAWAREPWKHGATAVCPAFSTLSQGIVPRNAAVADASPKRLRSAPTEWFPLQEDRMANIEDRAKAKPVAGINDDIGEETRLKLYRSQVVL